MGTYGTLFLDDISQVNGRMMFDDVYCVRGGTSLFQVGEQHLQRDQSWRPRHSPSLPRSTWPSDAERPPDMGCVKHALKASAKGHRAHKWWGLRRVWNMFPFVAGIRAKKVFENRLVPSRGSTPVQRGTLQRLHVLHASEVMMKQWKCTLSCRQVELCHRHATFWDDKLFAGKMVETMCNLVTTQRLSSCINFSQV